MSTRTIIEINHDYLGDLLKDPEHMHVLLRMARSGALAGLPNAQNPSGRVGLPGIRILGQRHHSDTLKLEVK
jgi:hypothetical protein